MLGKIGWIIFAIIPVVLSTRRAEAAGHLFEYERAVRHTGHVHFQGIDIDRFQGHTVCINAGQDNTVPLEAHESRAIAKIECNCFVSDQGFIAFRAGQSFQQCQSVSFAEPQSANTQIGAISGQCHGSLGVQLDVRAVVGLWIQRR